MSKNNPIKNQVNPKKNRIINTTESASTPIKNVINPEKATVKFSFECWIQIDNFGIGKGTDTEWFSSLLNKLKELSTKTAEELNSDGAFKKGIRFHKINFSAKNCPFRDEDHLLQLIPDKFKADPEISFYQFQVTMGKGRVHGFFDAKNNFQIVLLDPHHNMNPDKMHNYNIRPTALLDCEYEKAYNTLIFVKTKVSCSKSKDDDKIVEIKRAVEHLNFEGEFRHVLIPNAFYSDIEKLMENTNTYEDIDSVIMDALIALQDKISK